MMQLPYIDPTKMFHILVNLAYALPKDELDELEADALVALNAPEMENIIQVAGMSVLAAIQAVRVLPVREMQVA